MPLKVTDRKFPDKEFPSQKSRKYPHLSTMNVQRAVNTNLPCQKRNNIKSVIFNIEVITAFRDCKMTTVKTIIRG